MSKYIPLPEGVDKVTDRDFWDAVRLPPGVPKKGPLAEAIGLVRRGRHEAAYARLAGYHRTALRKEWDWVRETWLAKRPADPATLENLLAHTIKVWHQEVIRFGPKIDWQPAGQVSDNIHGLHRLHWLEPAVNAFIRTGDSRCRDFIVDMVTQYDEAQREPDWQAVRKIAYSFLSMEQKWTMLLPAYLALINKGDAEPDTIARFLRMFLIIGRATSATLGVFVPGFNMQAVAFTTLLHLARCFPEFRGSPAWDKQAVGLVAEHAARGFFEDGGTKERVWGYGTMHVSSLSKPLEIARRFGGLGGHEREVVATLKKACQWYFKTIAPPPSYAFPTYGDAGWGTHDRLPTVQAMARALPGKAKDPFLGVDRTRGCLLKPSGFAILRNGDSNRSIYANLNFGKFAGWHSHWDLLNMNVWAFGEPLLEELCRFGPYANPLDTLFRAPESHNLTLIDGMIYDSRLVEGQDVHWFSDDAIEYVSAYHRAYRYFVFGKNEDMPVSPNIEAKVRRTVLMVKDPGYFVVLDAVENIHAPGFNRAISQYWHAPKPFQVVGPGVVRTEGKAGCLLIQGRMEGLHRQDISKDFGGEEIAHLGTGYERYGLRVRRWMPINHAGITGFTTVLFPFQGRMPNVSVVPIIDTIQQGWKTEAIRIQTPEGADEVVLNPERLPGFSLKGKPVKTRALVRHANGKTSIVR